MHHALDGTSQTGHLMGNALDNLIVHEELQMLDLTGSTLEIQPPATALHDGLLQDDQQCNTLLAQRKQYVSSFPHPLDNSVNGSHGADRKC